MADTIVLDGELALDNVIDGQGADILPTYSGPFTITPAETEKTISVSGYNCKQNIKVAAIPADYVGSGVPRNNGGIYAPSSEPRMIEYGQYLAGDIMIDPVLCINLEPQYIKKGVTISIGSVDDYQCVTSVTGTYEP